VAAQPEEVQHRGPHAVLGFLSSPPSPACSVRATAGVLAALAGAAGAFLLAATLFGVSALVVLVAGRES
jgi:hypothetical protein